jgi:N-glycosylase/DNA lyase
MSLPGPGALVTGYDLLWGGVEEIGSPAYWSAQTWMWEMEEPEHFRLGSSLREEVLACLLGGYGIPAEVGLAAYARLRVVPSEVLLHDEAIYDLLAEPMILRGRSVRYRFARQKARRVAGAMARLPDIDAEAPDRTLRDALTALPGIGPKTASWIVRNWRGSDHVSILDVHVIRACRALGLFDPTWTVVRHYTFMEDAYLAFAKAIGARASILDSIIWMTMRRLPPSIVAALRPNRPRLTNPPRKGGFDRRQIALI